MEMSQWLPSLSATPTCSPTASGEGHPTHYVIRSEMVFAQAGDH